MSIPSFAPSARSRSLVSSGLLTALLAVAGCGRSAAVQTSSSLPLRRVVVYRNGVGYFERQGHVSESEVRFRVTQREVDDFLATLAVMEQGGSSVRSAAFPLPEEHPASDAPPADARRTVRLSLDGREHDLRVGYTVETPIWRPSYRLVFNGDTTRPDRSASSSSTAHSRAVSGTAAPDRVAHRAVTSSVTSRRTRARTRWPSARRAAVMARDEGCAGRLDARQRHVAAHEGPHAVALRAQGRGDGPADKSRSASEGDDHGRILCQRAVAYGAGALEPQGETRVQGGRHRGAFEHPEGRGDGFERTEPARSGVAAQPVAALARVGQGDRHGVAAGRVASVDAPGLGPGAIGNDQHEVVGGVGRHERPRVVGGVEHEPATLRGRLGDRILCAAEAHRGAGEHPRGEAAGVGAAHGLEVVHHHQDARLYLHPREQGAHAVGLGEPAAAAAYEAPSA